MSEAGLLIKNDNNDLLLNETYNNLYLFRKLKLTDLPYQTVGSGTNPSLSFATDIRENEILAPIARADGSSLDAFSIRANKWVIYAPRTWQSSTSELLADLDDVYVYIFGINTSTETSASGYGLQVFDENGVCVYNSNNKPMRVLHYANSVGDTDNTDAVLDGYVVPSNKVCAVWNCNIVRVSRGINLTRPMYFLNAYHADNDEIKQQGVVLGGAPVSFMAGDYIGYMVVDVTGY